MHVDGSVVLTKCYIKCVTRNHKQKSTRWGGGGNVVRTSINSYTREFMYTHTHTNVRKCRPLFVCYGGSFRWRYQRQASGSQPLLTAVPSVSRPLPHTRQHALRPGLPPAAVLYGIITAECKRDIETESLCIPGLWFDQHRLQHQWE